MEFGYMVRCSNKYSLRLLCWLLYTNTWTNFLHFKLFHLITDNTCMKVKIEYVSITCSLNKFVFDLYSTLDTHRNNNKQFIYYSCFFVLLIVLLLMLLNNKWRNYYFIKSYIPIVQIELVVLYYFKDYVNNFFICI